MNIDMLFSYLPESTAFIAFLAASLALNLTPGADMVFVLASGVTGGARAAVAATFGINLGVVVHILLAAGGIAALISAEPFAYDGIRFLGAAYLVWLAFRSWTARPQDTTQMAPSPFWLTAQRGFITNVLNPKTALFIFAFIPQFADPAKGAVGAQIAALGAVFIFTGFTVNVCAGVLAGVATARLRSASRFMNRLSAFVFGGLAVRLVID